MKNLNSRLLKFTQGSEIHEKEMADKLLDKKQVKSNLVSKLVLIYWLWIWAVVEARLQERFRRHQADVEGSEIRQASPIRGKSGAVRLS